MEVIFNDLTIKEEKPEELLEDSFHDSDNHIVISTTCILTEQYLVNNDYLAKVVEKKKQYVQYGQLEQDKVMFDDNEQVYFTRNGVKDVNVTLQMLQANDLVLSERSTVTLRGKHVYGPNVDANNPCVVRKEIIMEVLLPGQQNWELSYRDVITRQDKIRVTVSYMDLSEILKTRKTRDQYIKIDNARKSFYDPTRMCNSGQLGIVWYSSFSGAHSKETSSYFHNVFV